MGLKLRWVGDAERDRVAEVRARCYAHATRDLPRFAEGIVADTRAGGDDFLLAEQDGIAVGTAASLPLRMWVRGSALDVQGVAYVGTIKTHRRGAGGSPSGGIATRIMNATLARAREKGMAASALMPFRASFYDHFGYGLVETRHQWTLPLSVLPTGPFEGMAYLEPSDRRALEALRQRAVERGQCDLQRSSSYWDLMLQKAEDGFVVVDRSAEGPLRGFLTLQHSHEHGREVLRVMDSAFDDATALRRQLHFLASLKDQYPAVVYPLPADLPLHWLLREAQLPHRGVTHAHAELKVINRLQLRVLDHRRFIEPLHLPPTPEGSLAISVRESEGTVSKFLLTIGGGRGQVSASERPAQFECPDRVWAAIVCGELRAAEAARLGLADSADPRLLPLLDVFAAGPSPFCTEAF